MASHSRDLMAIVAVVSAALFNAAPVQAQGLAIAGQVGTAGVGGGVVVGVAPKINLRAMYGVVSGDPSVDVDDVSFVLDLPSFLLTTVDFYAIGGLHLSAGGLLITNDGTLNVVGTFDGIEVDFNGTPYTGGSNDRLLGTFVLKRFQPYLGIGLGNPVGKGIAINFDAGVGFGTTPTVELNAEGPLAEAPAPAGPAFLANLEANEADFEAKIPDLLRYYHVLSISISIGL